MSLHDSCPEEGGGVPTGPGGERDSPVKQHFGTSPTVIAGALDDAADLPQRFKLAGGS